MAYQGSVSGFSSVSAIALAIGVSLAGCSGSSDIFDKNSSSSLLAKPLDVFAKPDWVSGAATSEAASFGPKGPASAEELVGADGRCAPPVVEETPRAVAAQPAPAAPAADRAVGSMAGDLAGSPMPAASAPVPAHLEPAGPGPAFQPVLGGIALGMTECAAVRRAGLPSNVAISVGENNTRKVVLTYLGGTWPGVYTFASGRLKEISRVPEQPKPAKTKRSGKKPKTARQGTRVFVQ